MPLERKQETQRWVNMGLHTWLREDEASVLLTYVHPQEEGTSAWGALPQVEVL